MPPAKRESLASHTWSPRSQPNAIRLGHAQHQSPAEKVVGDGYRDLVVARFQRQREAAILQRTSSVGILSGRLLVVEIPVGVNQLAVHEHPQLAGPSHVDRLRLLPI